MIYVLLNLSYFLLNPLIFYVLQLKCVCYNLFYNSYYSFNIRNYILLLFFRDFLLTTLIFLCFAVKTCVLKYLLFLVYSFNIRKYILLLFFGIFLLKTLYIFFNKKSHKIPKIKIIKKLR